MQTVLCKEDARGDRRARVLLPLSMHMDACHTHVSVFYDEELCGVAYPPAKGREGKLKRISLVRVEDRVFPREVFVKDAEFVYRDPQGAEVTDGDLPFFAGAIPEGVYIGKSHDGRPYNAAARPLMSDTENENTARTEPPRVRTLPRAPARRRLPRFRLWGF